MAFLACVLLLPLLLVRGEEVSWTGPANQHSSPLNYSCPDNLAISGIASNFQSPSDRIWEFQCSSAGGLANNSITCTLQENINTLQEDMSFECPEHGYLGGVVSVYSEPSTDRTWSPLCCSRPHSSLINCQLPTSVWENPLRDNLNFTAPPGHVISGLESFYYNKDRRWRFRTCQIQVDCGDPGTPPNSARVGDLFLYTDQVSYTCNLGYHLSSGSLTRVCERSGLWSGDPPVCSACRDIADCADIRCSNSSDQRCEECSSLHGPALGESAYTNTGDACQAKCSWLTTFCFPGTCPGTPESCNCTVGFEGNDCLAISGSPDLGTCEVSILADDGSDSVLTCQSNSTNQIVHSNILPAGLRGVWSVSYVSPAPFPARPAYVSQVSVGVAVSELRTRLYRSANPGVLASSSSHSCEEVLISPDTPLPGLSACSSQTTPTNHTFLHGDRFEVEIFASAGGFLDITDLDSGSVQRHYYTATPTIAGSTFILDYQPPTHCSLTLSVDCLANQNILSLSGDIVTTNQITASWGGWVDTPSGIESYEFSVYYLEFVDPGLLTEAGVVLSNSTHNTARGDYMLSINLPSEGAYSFILAAGDAAGNVRYSRRSILYDTNSSALIDPTLPLVVVSAHSDTGYLWQNTTEGGVVIRGAGHFYNSHLRSVDYLAPLANYSLGIGMEFDQPNSGRFPRQGRRNALGIVELNYEVIVDQSGGNTSASLTPPTNFPHQASDIAIDNIGINISLQDGDSVRIWFQALDFHFQEAIDSVLVHVDSSPPELRDLSLVWNRVPGQRLHGTRLLTDLTAQFESYDRHSGLYQASWSLAVDGGEEVGSGLIPLPRVSPCPTCLCDVLDHCSNTVHSFSPQAVQLISSSALHDTDYILTVTLTNHALLSSTLSHRFTVDQTPPSYGHVTEGLGSGDIDYQTTRLLSAQWSGFFDRETDVSFYQYIFAEDCANASSFQYPVTGEATQTSDTYASWTAPTEGRYHVTVVAYNSALQPSGLVCSDGVTIDEEAPVISEVIIPSAVGSLVTVDTLLNITWTASDNYGIAAALVGVVSPDNFSSGNITYFNSAGQSHYSIFNPELLSNGNQFHVSVIVQDFADHESVLEVGPFTVDTTPPLINGSLELVQSLGHVTVTWDGVFSDPQSGMSDYEVAMGSSELSTDLQYFQPITFSDSCDVQSCTVVDTSGRGLLEGVAYYVTIKATNNADSAVYLSSPFVFSEPLPPVAVVYDTAQEFDITSLYNRRDVDVLLANQSLGVKWAGLGDHPLLVGLGTGVGLDDVVSMTTVVSGSEFQFQNVTLTSGLTYYSTVSVGNSSFSSDGVYVLGDLAAAISLATVNVENSYQASLTVFTAMWYFPSIIHDSSSYYQWSLARDGYVVLPYTTVGKSLSITSFAGLESGCGYQVLVRACFDNYCLSPVTSNGFRVVTTPTSSPITAVYTPTSIDGGVSYHGNLSISWEEFGGEGVVYYEWSIGNGEAGSQLIADWTRSSSTRVVGVATPAPLSLYKNNYVSVRGFNSAGLYSTASVLLSWQLEGVVLPQADVPVPPLAVYDLAGVYSPGSASLDWKQLEHHQQLLTDIDYTNQQSSLSAAWPLLRYSSYQWSISDQLLFMECGTEPAPLACGSTHLNGITVSDLTLDDGIYYICVRALGNNALYGSPGSVTHCSNGVTVSTGAPSGGCVQVLPAPPIETAPTGSGEPSVSLDYECERTEQLSYQVSTSDLVVVWDPFQSLIGMSEYQYAVGTVAGGNDVVDYVSVAIATYAVITELNLETGLVYHVTIRGIDLANQISDVVSGPVAIDTSPPVLEEPQILGSNSEGLELEWGYPSDSESGIAEVQWALGAWPGSADIHEWTSVAVGTPGSRIHLDSLLDGHTLFLSLIVINGAGLTGIQSSRAYTLDATPPSLGTVYHGGYRSNSPYTTSLSQLELSWSEFSDLESPQVEYFLRLGTSPQGAELRADFSVGSATASIVGGLVLSQGMTYYATVTACNPATLCSSAHSAGVTVDITPPVPGRILNGFSGSSNLQFQGSRTYLTAHLSGYHDDESGLTAHYWQAGLSPQDSSLVPPTKIPGEQTRISAQLTRPLPVNTLIYISVTSTNGAGLSVNTTSSGLVVDDSPPSVEVGVAIDNSWAGSVNSTSQYSGTALRLEWDIQDPHTSVHKHYWSLLSDSHVRTPIPAAVAGAGSHSTITGIRIQDGDRHSVLMLSCNQAGLCVQSESSPVLFDSSPPGEGYFVTPSSSEAGLNYSSPGAMTWRNRVPRGISQLNVAFRGFEDPHSGLSQYWSSVGSSYGSSDLSGNQPVPLEVEGSEVKSSVILLERLLTPGEEIVVSLWAVNGVGVAGDVVRGTFVVDPPTSVNNNGSLTLLRSTNCPLVSCLGHCTCGPRTGLCGLEGSCDEVDPSSLPDTHQLTVAPVSYQLTPGADDSDLYTAVSDKLIGRLEQVDTAQFVFLEWVVSLAGLPAEEGLVNYLGTVWMGVLNNSLLVFTGEQRLEEGRGYMFHIRAWINSSTYVVFPSEPITVDTVGVVNRRGYRVRLGNDSRFTSNTDQLLVNLNNVFEPRDLISYRVAVGDSPLADNIMSFRETQSDTTPLTNLDLRSGRTYYITAHALTNHGLVTTSVSHPVVVDTSRPRPGVLFSGPYKEQVFAVSSNTTYRLRSSGFTSPLSGVSHYEGAVTSSTQPPSSYANLGLLLSQQIEVDIDEGTFFPHLIAVSSAGVASEDVVVGVRVDATPPIGLGAGAPAGNIVLNPSFETEDGACGPDTGSVATGNWSLTGRARVFTVYQGAVPSGCHALLLSGLLSQTLATIPATWYRVTIATKAYSLDSFSWLTLDLSGHVTSCDLSSEWSECELLFQSVGVATILRLTTPTGATVLIDNIRVLPLHGFTSARNRVSGNYSNQSNSSIRISQYNAIGQSERRLQVHWLIADPETGIRNFQYAVGTVRGGEQKQPYKSSGGCGSVTTDSLELGHNERVFVTVAATNFAGLTRLFYSDPFLVDLTPPEVQGTVEVGVALGGAVWADWSPALRDDESGLVICWWGLGTSLGGTDVLPLTPVTPSTAQSPDLTTPHGTQVYAVVTCLNGAGQSSTAHSDAVVTLSSPPDVSGALVRVFSQEPLVYDTVGGALPSNNVLVVWEGFTEASGYPLSYQISLSNGSSEDWRAAGSGQSLEIREVPFDSYTVSVRAVSREPFVSQAVSQDVLLVTTPPLDTGTPVNYTWIDTNTLLFDWTDKFTSPAPLRYEVSLGHQKGSGSILMWAEFSSQQSSLELTDQRLIRILDYFISIVAIGNSGLSTTANQVVAGTPLET